MKLIHTADWQIGKPFRNFGDSENLLRHARLNAIENIGKLAITENVQYVLVAGDVYDNEAPSQKTLLEPLERMRKYPSVAWHVISGNHDPHRGNGIWDRVRAIGVPINVHLHLEQEPAELDDTAVLLPAPMRRKSEASDLSEWMNSASTAPGLIRIGLAHGSVVGFGAGGEANNPIAIDRAQLAGLDYLALGDWHRTMKVGPQTWYSGTHEADRFDSQELGQVLLVEITGPGIAPNVEARRTGSYRWVTANEEIRDMPELEGLETRLRAVPNLSEVAMKLNITGSLPIAGRAELDRRISGIEAATFHLNSNLSGLHIRPSLSDLESIDFGGVLREAAETLRVATEDEKSSPEERRLAEQALIELYLMTVNEQDINASLKVYRRDGWFWRRNAGLELYQS
jgi:DNA repair exonuclease SbcCD nuclease subunit